MFCRMKPHQREVLLELVEAKAVLAIEQALGRDSSYELQRVCEAEQNFEEAFRNEAPEEDC